MAYSDGEAGVKKRLVNRLRRQLFRSLLPESALPHGKESIERNRLAELLHLRRLAAYIAQFIPGCNPCRMGNPRAGAASDASRSSASWKARRTVAAE